MAEPLASDVVASAEAAASLLRSHELRERWDDESSCAGMTCGGLGHHLAGQAGNTVQLLSAPASDLEPISLEEHYRRAAWANTGLDEEANLGIRDGANQDAADGFDALGARVVADLAALPGVLGAAIGRRKDAVLIPWQGWALTVEDFLVTRLMEMVVHSDDLAESLGLTTPVFPDGAVRRALALLTAVSVARHGQTAVVRALSRPQRAPGSVSAF